MTRAHRRNRLILLLGVATSIGLISGCDASPGAAAAAYRPSEGTARKALDDALSTWRRGGKPTQLSASTPPVHIADFQWGSGAGLDDYKILDPAEGDEPGWFQVVLTLKKAKGEVKVRYLVIGKDDVWVYRDEDYAKFMNMGNDPRTRTKSGR